MNRDATILATVVGTLVVAAVLALSFGSSKRPAGAEFHRLVGGPIGTSGPHLEQGNTTLALPKPGER